MFDDLTQTLLNRHTAPPSPVATPPYSPPPNVPQHLPSRAKRWETAQKMISNYQNPNWSPNPILTRILNSK